LKCFEPLLIALTDKSKKADSLINIMEDAGIEKELLPELTLSLNKRWQFSRMAAISPAIL
jgi:hypothetical protein